MPRLVYCLLCALLTITIRPGGCKRYCRQDSDCENLGSLYCIRSGCSWGVCGCPTGRATKYLGSDKGYGCVPMRRVGEKCSNPGDAGICAASHSYCSEETGRCVCHEDYVAVWGGERCAPIQSTSAGETCSDSIGQCQLDGSQCRADGSDTYWYDVVSHGVPTCACHNTQRLVLMNLDVYDGQMVTFPSKKYPVCTALRIGDMCLKNGDCPVNAECTSGNVCHCREDYTKSYWGDTCRKPLNHGSECDQVTSEYHCDGSQGLVCGDMCDVSDTTEHTTCVCGPAHTTSGSTCIPIQEGDVCYGDLNCHGFSDTGYCDNGKCKSAHGGFAMATSNQRHIVLLAAVSVFLMDTYLLLF